MCDNPGRVGYSLWQGAVRPLQYGTARHRTFLCASSDIQCRVALANMMMRYKAAVSCARLWRMAAVEAGCLC